MATGYWGFKSINSYKSLFLPTLTKGWRWRKRRNRRTSRRAFCDVHFPRLRVDVLREAWSLFTGDWSRFNGAFKVSLLPLLPLRLRWIPFYRCCDVFKVPTAKVRMFPSLRSQLWSSLIFLPFSLNKNNLRYCKLCVPFSHSRIPEFNTRKQTKYEIHTRNKDCRVSLKRAKDGIYSGIFI